MKRKKLTCMFLAVMLILAIATVKLGAETQLLKLFVDPQTYTATVLGEVFTIKIEIANAQNVTQFEFKLGYNTTLLDAVNVTEGLFLEPVFKQMEINETEGYVRVLIMCWPVEGNVTLATITFKATHAEPASCALDLYDTALEDLYSNPIAHDVEDGNYEFMVLSLTVETDKPYYLPGEKVEIHGNLTAPIDGSPHQGLVALEIDDPTNSPIVVRTIQTGNTTTPGDVTIIDVVPCDMWGTPKVPPTYKRGATQIADFFYVKVTVENNNPTEWKNVVVTANIYDGNMVPVGVGAYATQLYPGPPESAVISIDIPEWASVGNATVYVNAFTTWPGRGVGGDYPLNGVPYCPEENATFEIINGGQGAGVGTPGSGNAGKYNLTFRLAPDATAGIYRVYVNSFYKGQFITSNTVFGVNVICVPDHYPTIQGAVDAATPTNNSILVCRGTYNEHVTINKSLKLVGIDPINTVINGSGTGTVVTVTADNLEISRFTIQNSGGSFPDSGIALSSSSDSTIGENTILENHCGVYLNSSSHQNTILDNTITSNNGYGINIHSSNDTDILQNIVSNNNYGICLNHSSGTTLRNNNLVCNTYNFGVFGDSLSDFIHNIDTSNTVDGKPIIYWVNKQNKQVPSNAGYVAVVNSVNIAVRNLDLIKNGQGVLFAYTAYSLLERVNVEGNGYAVYLINSYGNTIVGSTISNNTFGTYQRYSNENVICHNNFINNTDQVDLNQSSNTWDDGADKGNYWSDYTGLDDGSDNRTAGDGVGDTSLPHQGVDWYPLMNPWTRVHDVAATNVTYVIPYNVSYVYPGMMVDVTVTAKNKGDFTETFHIIAYYDDGNPIEMKQIIGLAPQKETAVDLTWDTTGVSPGNYTISANASEVFGETYLDDNAFIDGNVTVLEPTEHDVAVVSVTPSPTEVYVRYVVTVTVVARNEGHFTEVFNVTAYYEDTPIDTKTATLRPLSNTTLTFNWNTTGVSPGYYTISANASVVPMENETANNNLVDGTVHVEWKGDVNGDGKVNVLDLILVLVNTGPVPPKPPECDVNDDGTVNVLDLIIVLLNVG